ncbi:hypothetical protein HOP62_11000 [Halomonas sp. MCCC 1A17488]|nr:MULTISPECIES: hypothetical protein [unclassified Halomonas]MCE8016597.1 hypothetical protein [Halomonas sp. MCCC 1A17488]MCG3239930.1 hypothetical protein [Halomonas sp. MCCC 1A17488]QPP50177.1 hypothetical protein I4484_03370 [Halomonas sp. SS10-MC5]
MTQIHHPVSARHDDEVLHFWAALALQQQKAEEAIRRYLCDKAQQATPYPGSGA